MPEVVKPEIYNYCCGEDPQTRNAMFAVKNFFKLNLRNYWFGGLCHAQNTELLVWRVFKTRKLHWLVWPGLSNQKCTFTGFCHVAMHLALYAFTHWRNDRWSNASMLSNVSGVIIFCFAQGTAIFFKRRNSLDRAIYVTALWNKNTHFPPKAIEKRFPIIHDCWLILIELLLCDCLYFLPYTTRRVSEIFARLPLQLLKSVSTLNCAFIFQLVVGTFAEAWLRFRSKHLFGEIFEIECVYWAFITFNLPKKHWTHWSGIVSQEQA